VRRKCARCLKAKKTEKASPEDAETQDAELTARLLGALRDDPAVRAVAETLQRGRQKNTETARRDGEENEGEGVEEDETNARARRRLGNA
jgi:acyl-coenzyme A thioesterase PaaI-like protein